MADRESDDSHKSGGRSRDENETHRGWKSKWVESTSPRADDPIDDEKVKGNNIPGHDTPRDGGEKAT